MERVIGKAVAIVSGGLDSTVLAYWLKAAQVEDLHLISFNYGQRHAKELDFAKLTSTKLRAEWTLIDLARAGVTQLMKGSSLTDRSVEVPEGHYAEESMKATIVPNRNSIMLAIAYAAAVSDMADTVATAVHAGDHAIYPDCRPEFIEAFANTERLANAWEPRIDLVAPFLHKTKAQIVTLGATLGVPFKETWSCYKGGELHCGRCGTCVERKEAFRLGGVEDPTLYEEEPRPANVTLPRSEDYS